MTRNETEQRAEALLVALSEWLAHKLETDPE